MRIVHTKSAWEFVAPPGADPFSSFVARAARDGFEGLELFLPFLEEPPSRVYELMGAHGTGEMTAFPLDLDTIRPVEAFSAFLPTPVSRIRSVFS